MSPWAFSRQRRCRRGCGFRLLHARQPRPFFVRLRSCRDQSSAAPQTSLPMRLAHKGEFSSLRALGSSRMSRACSSRPSVSARSGGLAVSRDRHTPATGHRGMARLPRKQNRAPGALRPIYMDPGTEYARTCFARDLQAPDAPRWRAEKTRAQLYALGSTHGVGGLAAGGPQALWRRPPAPAAWAVGTSRRECFARLAERTATAHR
jgi:hypothetical protein